MASILSSTGRRAIAPVLRTNARGMATEKQLSLRIRSVKNIKKITSAMKMVAACKLRGAQDRLTVSRVFAKDVDEVFPKLTAAIPSTDLPTLVVPISGDKGLCGAVNSTIVRGARDYMLQNPTSPYKLVVYGEKAKQGLERAFGKNYKTTFSESGKLRPATFRQISELAEPIISTPHESCLLIYNNFRSMIAYDTTKVFQKSWAAQAKENAPFYKYQIEGDPDTLKNLHEFRTSANLYRFVNEQETSTLSSRMSAMDSSSKNAGDMLEKLKLLLNRNRQARITTEITEIISGAAAVEDA